MNIAVSKEIQDRTTKCPHTFSCLASGNCGNRELCEITSAVGENLLFIKPNEPRFCPYRLPFGYSQLCTCPTHFAIKRGDRFLLGGKTEPNASYPE
jgi:hypothetical protein